MKICATGTEISRYVPLLSFKVNTTIQGELTFLYRINYNDLMQIAKQGVKYILILY